MEWISEFRFWLSTDPARAPEGGGVATGFWGPSVPLLVLCSRNGIEAEEPERAKPPTMLPKTDAVWPSIPSWQ